MTGAGPIQVACVHIAYDGSDRVRLQFRLPTRSLTSSNGWSSIGTQCSDEKHEAEQRAERELGHCPRGSRFLRFLNYVTADLLSS